MNNPLVKLPLKKATIISTTFGEKKTHKEYALC